MSARGSNKWRLWTPEEDATLRANYATKTREQIAALLNRPEGSVRSRCHTLKLNTKAPAKWTRAEEALLFEWYTLAAHRGCGPTKLRELAGKLGRHVGNVARKARGYGLTDQRRCKKAPEDKHPRRPKYTTREARSAANSLWVRNWFANHGHPKGMLGKKHSPATLARLSETSTASWADTSTGHHAPERAERLRESHRRRVAAGLMIPAENAFSRCKRGRRADLGKTFFRSRWEANYARYLNKLLAERTIQRWEYEPKSFLFETAGRVHSYTPDFFVQIDADHHEWHEVKGWMTSKGATQIRLMQEQYPNEPLVIVGVEWFKKARRAGLAKQIPNWEADGPLGQP